MFLSLGKWKDFVALHLAFGTSKVAKITQFDKKEQDISFGHKRVNARFKHLWMIYILELKIFRQDFIVFALKKKEKKGFCKISDDTP